MKLAGDCHAAYLKARPSVRRRFNQAMLEAVYVKDRIVARAEFSEVFAPLFSRPPNNPLEVVPTESRPSRVSGATEPESDREGDRTLHAMLVGMLPEIAERPCLLRIKAHREFVQARRAGGVEITAIVTFRLPEPNPARLDRSRPLPSRAHFNWARRCDSRRPDATYHA